MTYSYNIMTLTSGGHFGMKRHNRHFETKYKQKIFNFNMSAFDENINNDFIFLLSIVKKIFH